MSLIAYSIPFNRIQAWLEKEKELGSPFPDRVVLATATPQGVPSSRIVAIRELTEQGLVFFTQLGTKKTHELRENPCASMTLWLALQQRQVILDGNIISLTQQENESFWKALPQERQLRFSTYAPLSGQPISSAAILEDEFQKLTKTFKDQPLPVCKHYCGYRLLPESISFYTLGTQNFSESIKYTLHHQQWKEQLISP
ncbi:pyridoxine/pyridoxamine 5'-phosphate oxidase [Candidatus Protochlamydia phocaeensis]|uniref:pyridoxine/pyridoxamine 5'-phosphate oxidase n=1 Tax=Candidatus Protochlamydia phocaeensis TaxID=1414722 RepID=UPI001E4F458F|nr:pyridoxamine 5'-phosphate oxidase family protein [Candidatus Protochlamydia phocaeensis]